MLETEISAELRHQLIKDLTVEANYVGSSSHKLTSLVDANPFILGTTNRVFNTQPGNSSSSFSYLDEFRNVGSASYNGMQLALHKQYSSRGSENGNFFRKLYSNVFATSDFTFAYTYGHSIDTASGFRQRNSRVPFTTRSSFALIPIMTSVIVLLSAVSLICRLSEPSVHFRDD